MIEGVYYIYLVNMMHVYFPQVIEKLTKNNGSTKKISVSTIRKLMLFGRHLLESRGNTVTAVTGIGSEIDS